MAERLAWPNFSNRKLYDFGCGVRFARTIANLDLDFDRYVGVDVNATAIRWLQEHLSEPKFRFAHIDGQNLLYNPRGKPLAEHHELPLADERFDAVSMFSVITHQAPSDAAQIFSLIRRSIVTKHLYFTAFIDDSVDGYIEGNPAKPLSYSTYSPGLLRQLLTQAAWKIEHVYEPSPFQQAAFVCVPH
jgi:Methyltransferase domain